MLGQTVLMPDAELVVVEYLRARLATRPEPHAQGVTVGTRMPAAATPGRYLLVRRTGGTTAGLVVDAARIDLMVWHDTDHARVALAQLARGLLRAAAGLVLSGVPIYRVVEFVGPVNLPDPANETRTVTMFTVELRLRGAAA